MIRLYNGVFRIDRPFLANARRIDQGMLPMVLEMNRTGIKASPSHFRRLGEEFAARYDDTCSQIATLAGRPVNPISGDQVAALLFDELKLEPPAGGRMTESQSRLSTGDEILCAMLDQHPVVRLITDARELDKLKGTYCDPIPGFISPTDGRVRTTFKIYTARTGRLSSEEPNLQNIPVRGEDGRKIRAGFIADTGKILVSHDLSQIEMVWAAELSRDRVMMEVYSLGQDLHVRTACALFRLDYDHIAPLWKQYKKGELTGPLYEEMRDFELNKRLPAKTLGFAVLYGVTPKGLRLQILAAGGPSLTEEECAEYIRRWFDLFSGVYDWMQTQYARARRYGMTWTALGRPRNILEVYSALGGVRNQGLRQAGNTPVQGTAGDHLKLAMAEIWDGPVQYFRSFPGVTCDPLLQVHDELIFELSPEIVDDFNQWTSYIMCTAVRPMEVTVKSSAVAADNWGDLK